jgi:diguanylate cyclase (GGDEF)-like protein/PAS domain S-box-containing protein
MASAPQDRRKRDRPIGSNDRRPLLHILFLHSHLADVEQCLQELKRVRFTVDAEVVVTAEEFNDQLSSREYDLVVAEYPNSYFPELNVLDLLHRSKRQIPLIIVSATLQRETAAELVTRGAYDCIEMNHISHLPVAIHRALHEKALRDERDRAENFLLHSEARYRALSGNLSYGICRCGLDGKFLEVNDAMVRMLGYASKEELLSANHASEFIQDPGKRAQLLGRPDEHDSLDPLEMEWRRKDGKTVKVRLSGQEVISELHEHDTYEVIAEDVTQQRQLEDHLRWQAARDPLTGLANYRCLTEVIDTEIKRSERTGREFALLLFDLDGLKQINDRYGHTTGSQALCRVADALSFCRDIDTAARYGGDEFAVVLPETGASAAYQVARRITEGVANDGTGPRLSVSIGVAIYPYDGEGVESLLHAADLDMYSMKAKKHKLLNARKAAS